jgi:hypothetical protein
MENKNLDLPAMGLGFCFFKITKLPTYQVPSNVATGRDRKNPVAAA